MTCKGAGEWLNSPALCNIVLTLSCPQWRKPAASLMAALERSSLGLMCIRIFTGWLNRLAGVIASRHSVLRKDAFLHWAAKLARCGSEVHDVYGGCGVELAMQR